MALTDLTFQRQDPFDRLYKMASTAYLLQKPELDEQTRQVEMQKLQMQNKQQIMEGNLGLLKTILPKLDDNTVNDVLGALTESDPMYNNIFQIIKNKGVSFKTKAGEKQLIQDNLGNWLAADKETRIAEPVLGAQGEQVKGKPPGATTNIPSINELLANAPTHKLRYFTDEQKKSMGIKNNPVSVIDTAEGVKLNQYKELPEKVIESVQSRKSIKTQLLDNLEYLVKNEIKTDPATGLPVIGPLVKKFLKNEQFQGLASVIDFMANKYRHDITGAQAGWIEIQRIYNTLATLEDIDVKTFKEKTKQLAGLLNRLNNDEVKFYGEQGYFTGNLTEKISPVGRTKSGLIELSDGRQVSPEDAKKIISGE